MVHKKNACPTAIGPANCIHNSYRQSSFPIGQRMDYLPIAAGHNIRHPKFYRPLSQRHIALPREISVAVCSLPQGM